MSPPADVPASLNLTTAAVEISSFLDRQFFRGFLLEHSRYLRLMPVVSGVRSMTQFSSAHFFEVIHFQAQEFSSYSVRTTKL